MSTDNHVPLAFAGPLTSAYMEAPLGQLDAAINAVDAKVGVPSLGRQLRGTGTGTSEWSGFTEIVFPASGGDDAAALQALVDDATEGTVFILPDPAYDFTAVDADNVHLNINKRNIWFRGMGRESALIGTPDLTGRSTVIRCRTTGATMIRWGPASVTPGTTGSVSSVSVANPTVITTSAPHGLATGNIVFLSALGTTPSIVLASYPITVTGASTFTIAVNVTAVADGAGTWQLVASDTIQGGGMRGITIAGNAKADTCLRILGGTSNLIFEDCWIGGASSDLVYGGQDTWSGGAVTAASMAISSIQFMRCRLLASGSCNVVRMDASASILTAGCYFWMFQLCQFQSVDGNIFDVSTADDCWALGCGFFVTGTGYSAEWKTSSWTFHFVACEGAYLGKQIARGTGLTIPARGHMILGMSTVDTSVRPTIEPGAQLWMIDDQGRSNYRLDSRYASIPMQDDFAGGTLTSGNVGDEGWTVIAGTLTALPSEAGHPGILDIDTTAAGTLSGIYLGGAPCLLPSETFESIFVFRIPTTASAVIARIGFAANPTSASITDGIYLEKVNGGAFWRAISMVSSASTAIVLTTIVSGTWVRLRIRRRHDTSVGISIADFVNQQDGAQFTDPNIPTVPLYPFVVIDNNGAASSTLDIDFAQLYVRVAR